ncbi:hypothetical protein LINPERHAP2_LOCUS35882 [Linum perenne]
MELPLTNLCSFPAFTRSTCHTSYLYSCEASREFKCRVWSALDLPAATFSSSSNVNILNQSRRKPIVVPHGLVETAASIAIAATVVGGAATLLVNRTKATEANDQIQLKTCEECGGSGICSECKGEGFVLKRLSDENADKARKSAKNMATRYTAGLPKKWSYCTKCSSSRSCITCNGRGKLSY